MSSSNNEMSLDPGAICARGAKDPCSKPAQGTLAKHGIGPI
jgi:hypothetical protein